jgi:hypothetical protein
LSGGEVVFAAVATTGTDGAAIAQAVKMGSTSDPIAVTFRANGSAVNPGAIYLAHATEPRVELGRAIEILSTGKVDTWRYSVSGSPGPWMKWI